MKIKKGINLVIFFNIFIGGVLIFLILLGFFLGFEINSVNIIICVALIVAVLLLQLIGNVLYFKLCKAYYIFNEKEIIFISQKSKQTIIKYNEIKSAVYYKISHLLVGDPKGGNLIICYNTSDGKENGLEIPISFRILRKIPVKFHIVVKSLL